MIDKEQLIKELNELSETDLGEVIGGLDSKITIQTVSTEDSQDLEELEKEIAELEKEIAESESNEKETPNDDDGGSKETPPQKIIITREVPTDKVEEKEVEIELDSFLDN